MHEEFAQRGRVGVEAAATPVAVSAFVLDAM